MRTKDGRDTPIEKLTADNYIVPKGEERYYHALIEVVQFDKKTGDRLSKPRVQKFGKKIFETHVQDSLRKQGFTVTILHDPNIWEKQQREQSAKIAAEEKAAKEKAEEERFDKAVEEAVKKELAKAAKAAKDEKPAKGDKAAKDESKGDKPADGEGKE